MATNTLIEVLVAIVALHIFYQMLTYSIIIHA